jgi:succinyl-CoA synthetase alpha subunit
MAILASRETRVLVQGITGREGTFHTQRMIDYGTSVVGGVTPGKGGEWVYGKPVFDTVSAAVDATGADASVIYVSAPFAADAIFEAIEAGLRLIVCITKGIPIRDMVSVAAFLRDSSSRLIGPNSPGLLIPGQVKIGVIPGEIAMPGSIGIVSRSGTLTYEVMYALTQAGLGQSACVGIGGDPITGTTFVEALALFEEDPQTEAVVVIGEVGDSAEIEAANFIRTRMTKPVTACIAGAWSERGEGGSLIAALRAAGARIADHPEQIPELLRW